MEISYIKLRKNEKALEKYYYRYCKVFCPERQAWIKVKRFDYTEYTLKESEALIEDVKMWHRWFRELSDTSQIILHFISKLGDKSSPNLKEYNEEDIYNDALINFDKFTTKWMK